MLNTVKSGAALYTLCVTCGVQGLSIVHAQSASGGRAGGVSGRSQAPLLDEKRGNALTSGPTRRPWTLQVKAFTSCPLT
jgi:hypothetical protein